MGLECMRAPEPPRTCQAVTFNDDRTARSVQDRQRNTTTCFPRSRDTTLLSWRTDPLQWTRQTELSDLQPLREPQAAFPQDPVLTPHREHPH